jgi:hypothetical protein
MATALADDDFEADLAEHGNQYAYRKLEENRAMYASSGHDALVDECMDRIHKTNTCNSGGWAYWIDKEGCHKVYLR